MRTVQQVTPLISIVPFTTATTLSKLTHGTSCTLRPFSLLTLLSGSTVPNQPAGAFWAVLNWLLVIVQTIVCILAEVEWPSSFFAVYFPVLGPDFGLGALGVIQCLLGAAVLSHHVGTFALVASFFVFALGCVNILAGLIFRGSVKARRSMHAWRTRFDDGDVLPPRAKGVSVGSISKPRAQTQQEMFTGRSLYTNEKAGGAQGAFRSDSVSSDKSGLGFGRQGAKWAEAQGMWPWLSFEYMRPMKNWRFYRVHRTRT
jgi:hypothetical protein